ncbi:hypothetical protein DFH06DRAFT_1225767 [Mycena polygramma]|nr:hypothetical protein DFH06DRAFT_1225767 [Mycena polygramma]
MPTNTARDAGAEIAVRLGRTPGTTWSHQSAAGGTHALPGSSGQRLLIPTVQEHGYPFSGDDARGAARTTALCKREDRGARRASETGICTGITTIESGRELQEAPVHSHAERVSREESVPIHPQAIFIRRSPQNMIFRGLSSRKAKRRPLKQPGGCVEEGRDKEQPAPGTQLDRNERKVD